MFSCVCPGEEIEPSVPSELYGAVYDSPRMVPFSKDNITNKSLDNYSDDCITPFVSTVSQILWAAKAMRYLRR